MTRTLIQLLVAICLAAVLGIGCSKESSAANHAERAEEFFKRGDYDRAELEYKNLLRLDPTNQMALRNLGVMYFEQGRLLRAFVLLSESAKARPDDAEVRVKHALALLSGGKSAEAREEVLQVLSLQPTNEDALLLLVDASVTTNSFQDARRRLAELKPVAGGLASYQVALGMASLRVRETNTALECFRQALSVDPQSSAAHAAMGGMHLYNRNLTNALEEFKMAADLAPWRSNFRLRYADLLITLGRPGEAKQYLSELSKQAPDYLPALMRLAQLALGERRFTDCEGTVKSVLAREGVHLEAIVLLSQLRIAQNQPEEAVAELQRVLKIAPKVPQIHYQLALAYLAQNDLATAASSLGEALTIQPDYAEAAQLLAELDLRRGNTSQAISSLTKLVQERPSLTAAQLLLASAYQAAKKPSEALQIYENLSLRFPNNPQAYFLIGLIHAGQSKRAEARSSFEKVLSLAPDYIAALEQLINLDILERRFGDAEARAQKELGRNETNAAPYLLLAKVQMAQTNLVAAEQTLRRALEVEPESSAVNSLLAQVYVSAKKQEAALSQYQAMVARNTNDISSWMRIAELHSAATNYPAASQAYETFLAADPRLLARNPRYPMVLNNLAWLYSEHLGNPKRAYELASRARELSPGNPFAADTFGWVLYRNGDYVRALALVQESVRALSENSRQPEPEVLFHLGMIHYMMGEEAAARVALQRATQMAPADASWKQEAQQRLTLLDTDPATADAAAIQQLEQLAAKSPPDPILFARLGTAAELAGNWSGAIAHYERALQVNTNLATVVFRLARAYEKGAHDPERALALARRARGLSPNDSRVAHLLGRLAFAAAKTGADFQWSNGLLQESARNLASDPEVLFDAAMGSYALGDVPSAVSGITKVISLPAAPEILAAAKKLLDQIRVLEGGDPTTVASEVAEQLRTEPNSVPALMLSARLLEQKGDFPGARVAYERATTVYPLFSPAIRALAFLYANQLKDPAKAYDYAVKARELLPQDLQLARLLGILSYGRGDYPRAVQLLKQAIPEYEKDAELRFTLGFAYYHLKQAPECRESLNRALAIVANGPQADEARRILGEIK